MAQDRKSNPLTTIGITNRNDDKYEVVKDEVEQIRKFLGMYIGKEGTDGALHLLQEGTNNTVDECVNPRSKGNHIIIEFHEETGSFRIEDNGRGIPFERIEESCLEKHSTTKADRSEPWVKGLAGRNGVGMVAINALTKDFTVISKRDGYKKTVKFIKGKLQPEIPLEKLAKKSDTGTTFIFTPSENYLRGIINVESHMVEDYLRNMSYVIPEHIVIDYIGYLKDGNPKEPYVQTYQRQGIISDLKYLCSDTEVDPVEIKIVTDPFDLELCFSYSKTLDDMIIDSFANYIHTTERGTHESVVEDVICTFFTKEGRKDEKAKYKITAADCRKGLVAVVNCSHIDPSFEGQHKSKISNRDIIEDGKPALLKELSSYFERNPQSLRKIIAYLRLMAKLRVDASEQKSKAISEKKHRTFLDDSEIPGFENTSDRNYSGYTEVFFTEGKSAGDSINNAVNRKYQAIYKMRGPIDNVCGMTEKTALVKQIIRNIVEILGCGAGKTFDITKLRWNKVIILTDADIDGANLASLIINFIWRYMRGIITSGRLYVILPPFYLLDEKEYKKWTKKGNPWVYDIREYYHIINNAAVKMITLFEKVEDTENEYRKLSQKEAFSLLEMNADYLLELEALEKKSYCNPIFLEHICYASLLYNGDMSKMVDYIHEKFPELIYYPSDECFRGSYNGKHIDVIVDHVFFMNAKRFITILDRNNYLEYKLINQSKENDLAVTLTIGQIITLIRNQIVITVKQRYKGLGEAEAYILFLTTMNPKLRKLKRITVDNIDKVTETLDMLHGKSKENTKERRMLLEKTQISRFDIDN